VAGDATPPIAPKASNKPAGSDWPCHNDSESGRVASESRLEALIPQTSRPRARGMSTDLNSNAAHEIARHVTLPGERQVSQPLRM
jgi:hypothetical protein